MSMPSLPELIVVLVIILLVFGGSKLPQLGGAIGQSIKNFKKGLHDGDAQKQPTKEVSDKNEKGIHPS